MNNGEEKRTFLLLGSFSQSISNRITIFVNSNKRKMIKQNFETVYPIPQIPAQLDTHDSPFFFFLIRSDVNGELSENLMTHLY